jgi:hypothetical protein
MQCLIKPLYLFQLYSATGGNVSTGNNVGNVDEQCRLEKWYEQNMRRFLCHCKQSGVETCIARIKKTGNYIIKCKPGTGFMHHIKCDYYEVPPPELSGRDTVIDAIQEIGPGIFDLKLEFRMHTHDAGSPEQEGAGDKDTVKRGGKLTLRALLHLLWEDSGFNEWSPTMERSRTWAHIQKVLLKTAESLQISGDSLAARLYIPEEYILKNSSDIIQRRNFYMKGINGRSNESKRLGLLIGMVKIIPSEVCELTVKHSPYFTFRLGKNIHKRFWEQYGTELARLERFQDYVKSQEKDGNKPDLSKAPDEHLFVAATFTVNSMREAFVEKAALMRTTRNSIPYETPYDKDLIDLLTKSKRRFVKVLRYDRPESEPLACVALIDTEASVTAMYIQPKGAESKAALDDLQAKSKLKSETWVPSESDEKPKIPPPKARE